MNKIKEKRDLIRSELFSLSETITNGKLEKLEDNDLYILLELYDKNFLNNYFKDRYKGKIKLKFSQRLKTSAGITKYKKYISFPNEEYMFEINISADFLLNYYRVDRDIIVNGIKTKDSLEAMMLVFEHELCHVIENIKYSYSSCKGERFKNIANSIFGHLDVRHALPTHSEVNNLKYKINVGDRVFFDYSGKNLNGIVNKINKRITVMVENQGGEYIDKTGKRYEKFYVPFSRILDNND